MGSMEAVLFSFFIGNAFKYKVAYWPTDRVLNLWLTFHLKFEIVYTFHYIHVKINYLPVLIYYT